MAHGDLPIGLQLAISLLMLAGGTFALVGAIGLVRLRDLYQRLHGPTKASTLGVGGVLLASMAYFGWIGGRLVIHELLITLFVFMTAPIASHLMMKSALEREPLRRPPPPVAAPPVAGPPVAAPPVAAPVQAPRAPRDAAQPGGL